MAGMRQGIEAELMLLNWSENSNSGCKLIFEISDDELKPFKTLKTRAGKKVAGQRFAAVLVLIDDDESVVPVEQAPKPVAPEKKESALEAATNAAVEQQEKESKRRGGFADSVGPRARLAVQWCADSDFQQWLISEYDTYADAAVEQPGGDKLGLTGIAKSIICQLCDVTSRSNLDETAEAGQRFDELVRVPYAEHLKKRLAVPA